MVLHAVPPRLKKILDILGWGVMPGIAFDDEGMATQPRHCGQGVLLAERGAAAAAVRGAAAAAGALTGPAELPSDERLRPVTAAVRAVLGLLASPGQPPSMSQDQPDRAGALS